MLGSALETRKDIVVTSTQNDLDATFEVTTLSQFSEVSYIAFNCGDGGQDSTTIEQDNKASFTCSYANPGTYEVRLGVVTASGNVFAFIEKVTVNKSLSTSVTPSFLLAFVVALFFFLVKY